MQWCHWVGRNRDSNIVKLPNDWLKFQIIDSIQGFYDHQMIILLLILLNSSFYWRKMLLVAHIDMV
jgi:hypothetical protein